MGSAVMKTNKEYKKWIEEISLRFRKSQIKAALKVNSDMLRFYWSLGKDISEMSKKTEYGKNFYKSVSEDLKERFPNVKSFSVTNLKYMRYFYEMYPEAGNRQQLADDFKTEWIFQIPWGHHMKIFDKCRDNPNRAMFYVRKTLENNWSRAVLMNFLDTDFYEREGKALTNFSEVLPDYQGDLAQAITRDPYNFDFLTIREKYNEKELKDALMDNLTHFLLELGNDFTFKGREVRIEMGETENFIDMLFYNTRLRCYVVVEIKVRGFNAGDMGQLGTYMVAVNHQIKGEDDNPTLGLLICKSKDDIKAKYALEASSQPVGISEYDISGFIPEEFKGSLPSIDEIEAELEDGDVVKESFTASYMFSGRDTFDSDLDY